jgi:CheY-like chemotaxis protein
MDVQMPEMDGYEATAAILAAEQGTTRRTPIIAMTALAMKGDRERCLAAGMDGYVAKPVDREQLFNAIVEAVESSSSSAAANRQIAMSERGDESGSKATPDILDLEAAQVRIPGGMKAVKRMARLLLDECPKMLREIHEALLTGDAVRLQRGAHTLKGSADVFAAQQVVAAAERLEIMGREDELGDGVKGALGELEVEVRRLLDAISSQTSDSTTVRKIT